MGITKPKSILFLNLTAFSQTGGIEKFNRCFLKALSELEENHGIKTAALSLYDSDVNEKYFRKRNYKGFSGRRLLFIFKSIAKAQHFDCVVLGHINLAIIGFVLKILFPRKTLLLVAHGIEVWQPLRGIKKSVLKNADLILAVSSFTENKLRTIQNVDANKTRLFYNTIDPFFVIPSSFGVSQYLRDRYGLSEDDFILYTFTRLASGEQYKGYDIVIECLPQLLKSIPNLKYVIAGKYDKGEKDRLDVMIKKRGLEKTVLFTNYIKEAEVKDHFQMGNLFIMPSKGEGFGIVFIEAMICGLPVVAGNQDGSVDALQHGELGSLVNPNSVEEITATVLDCYQNKQHRSPDYKYQLQQKTLGYFGFDQYKKRLEHCLLEN